MVTWLIGMSGAGKTEIANVLYKKIVDQHPNTVLIDGDVIRRIMGDDLGHTLEDRKRNSDRICQMCKWLDEQGINVVCAVLSLFHEAQAWNRENYSKYCEVFIDVSFEILTERDNKGLYKKALSGQIKDVAGVDIEFKSADKSRCCYKKRLSKRIFSRICKANRG